jgi:GTP-binding protein
VDYEVIQTIVPSLYTVTPLDPNHIDFASFHPSAKRLFDLHTKFVSPEEFKYALPNENVPEFAFVGRSNVGKSSLISSLLRDKKLVRVSKEPGCTRSVNYYAFATKGDQFNSSTSSHVFYLVDLPGYGFAKVAKAAREAWNQVIDGFLQGRPQSTLRSAPAAIQYLTVFSIEVIPIRVMIAVHILCL